MTPFNAQSNPYEILSDIMTTVVMIFLVFILLFVLTAGSKLAIDSDDNAFTGGNQRPVLFLVGNRYITNQGKEKNIVSFMQLDSFVGGQGNEFFDVYLDKPEGILAFIDPGEVVYKNEKYSAIQVMTTNPNVSRVSMIHDEGYTYKGSENEEYVWETIYKIWGGNRNYFSKTLPSNFRINKRAAIYYESISNGPDEPKYIIVGHHKIKIDDQVSEDPSFMFLQQLSTSMVDFVYLGERYENKREDFFEKHYGPESKTYYEEWLNKNSYMSPFIAYPGSRILYVKEHNNKNIMPPDWVRNEFLTKLGVTHKIVR